MAGSTALPITVFTALTDIAEDEQVRHTLTVYTYVYTCSLLTECGY